MEKDLLSLAQDIYGLSKKAGLLTAESFSEVFPDQKIKKLDQDINRDKNIFLENNRDINDSESLWELGVQYKIRENLLQIMMDFLQEKGKAFMVNWDQPVEDIVYNFKTVNTGLPISDLGEKQVDGQWYQGVEIEGKPYWYPASPEGYVPEVLGEIGKHLQKLSLVIVCLKAGDENQYTVIGEELLPEFEKFDFSTV